MRAAERRVGFAFPSHMHEDTRAGSREIYVCGYEIRSHQNATTNIRIMLKLRL